MRVALTDRFVKHAKPGPGARAEYFDHGTPGLALRVSPGGQKAWTFLFTSPKDGKRARLTIGSYPAQSLATARTAALEAQGHVEGGRDPRDVLAAQKASAMTVAMLAENYLAMHVRPNLRTAANFELRLKKNVLPIIGSVRLEDLHPRDINRVLDPIIARKRPIEANRVYENLRAMFRWAARRGDLDRSPLETMVKPAPESTPRERVLSDDEIRQMWTNIPAVLSQSKAAQRIVKLCLATNQRVGEVAGMAKSEIDIDDTRLDQALWSLPSSRTKNGVAHTVPLSLLAVDIIREALKDSGGSPFLFPSPEPDEDEKPRPIDPHAIATTLRRAHARTEKFPRGRFSMEAWTAHDLRRTGLTHLAQLGVAPIVIGAVANHLSVTNANVTFAHYVQHDYALEKRRALDLWADQLGAIIAGGHRAAVVPMHAQR